jgi:hypothetical protein
MTRIVAIGLGAGRVAIGAGLWLAPGLVSKTLGFDEPDARTLALARIAATRDLVLGSSQIRSVDDPRARERAAVAGAVCDAGDAVAFALALRDPATRAAGVRGVPLAVAATIAGVWLASR